MTKCCGDGVGREGAGRQVRARRLLESGRCGVRVELGSQVFERLHVIIVDPGQTHGIAVVGNQHAWLVGVSEEGTM